MPRNNLHSSFFFLLFALLCFLRLTAQDSSNMLYTLADTTEAHRLVENATALAKQGAMPEAARNLQEAIEVYKQILPNSRELADAWHQLGTNLYKSGRLEPAIDAWEAGKAIRLHLFGEKSEEVAKSHNNLGIGYNDLGNYQEALSNHQKALEIKLALLGPNDFSVSTAYNNLASTYQAIGEYLKAEQAYRNALAIRTKLLPPNNVQLVSIYQNLGTIRHRLGDYNEAIGYYQKALAICREKLGKDHTVTGHLYSNMGVAYEAKGDADRAIGLIEKAIAIAEQRKDNGAPIGGISYGNLGKCYLTKGDYQRAIQYYEKAIAHQSMIVEQYHPEIAILHIGLGNCYTQSGDFDRAISHFETALNIRRQAFPKDHPLIAETLSNLAVVYREQRKFEQAIIYLEQALAIELKNLDEAHPAIATIHNNLGLNYQAKRDYSRARENFESAISIQRQVLPEKHPQLARTYKNLGLLSQEMGAYGVAEQYFTKALYALNYSENQEISNVNSLPELIEALGARGGLYYEWHSKSGDPLHLHTARSAFQRAMDAVDFQSTLVSNASRHNLADHSHDLVQYLIMLDKLLYDLSDSIEYQQEALQFAERSKSYLLYEAIQETDALYFAGLPDSLIVRERDLRIDITYLEKRRQNELSSGATNMDSIVLVLSSRLLGLHQELEELIDFFEEHYPTYHELKYQRPLLSVKSIQKELLSRNQALLEYFIGDHSIFLFLVRKHDFHLLEIRKDFSLDELVQKFLESITGFHTANRPSPELRTRLQTQYVETAILLYDKLIAPVRDLLPERLVIIPDGALGYLPFEALLVERPARTYRYNNHHYLMRDHAISYAYSATLLREMRQRKHAMEPQNTLLAMAPYYDGDTSLLAGLFPGIDKMRKELQSLPYSGEEAWQVSQLWDGDVFVGAEATEEHFTQLAGDYRILHLATHGQANDQVGDYSFLAFSEVIDSIENELLYVRDLYNLRLNADLVVLSACETGIGELQRGEGIISLARAFAFAGARSIITTLWSVADAKTKDFILEFYHQLKNGQPKDLALKKARLNYLKAHPGPEEAHPFFWAGFVGIGEMAPLPN